MLDFAVAGMSISISSCQLCDKALFDLAVSEHAVKRKVNSEVGEHG